MVDIIKRTYETDYRVYCTKQTTIEKLQGFEQYKKNVLDENKQKARDRALAVAESEQVHHPSWLSEEQEN